MGLTDFFLELLACLDDLLNDSAVSVVLILVDLGISGLPVVGQISIDLRFNVTQALLDVLSAALELRVQVVTVVHQQDQVIRHRLLVSILTNVGNAVDFLEGVDFECT